LEFQAAARRPREANYLDEFAETTIEEFDDAGDVWSFTYGATAEWKQDWWTARAGVFQLSRTPGSTEIEPILFRQFQSVVEFEERHTIQDQPGKLKFLFYANDGFMGSFNQAVTEAQAMGVTPGDLWGRDKDQIGIGGVLNDISHAHANYLAAGGTGIILGDGALSYDGERILEAYYKYTIADGVHVSLDYQFVDNPAYNIVRGPVSLFALRFHAEF
jgi:high affinity Mn2+ porin